MMHRLGYAGHPEYVVEILTTGIGRWLPDRFGIQPWRHLCDLCRRDTLEPVYLPMERGAE